MEGISGQQCLRKKVSPKCLVCFLLRAEGLDGIHSAHLNEFDVQYTNNFSDVSMLQRAILGRCNAISWTRSSWRCVHEAKLHTLHYLSFKVHIGYQYNHKLVVLLLLWRTLLRLVLVVASIFVVST